MRPTACLLGELADRAWRAMKLYFDSYFESADVTPGAAGILETSGELRSAPSLHYS